MRLVLAAVLLAVLAGCDDAADDAPVAADAPPVSRCAALAAPLEIDLPSYGGGAEVPQTTHPAAEQVERLVGDHSFQVVDGLVALWYVQRHDVVVFLEPDAPPGALGAVARTAGAVADDGVTIMSREDTYAEFLTLFADQPEITESVTPDILPTSVRFQVAERLGAEAPFDSLAAVREVVLRYDDPIVDAQVDALLDDPAAIDRLQRLADPLAADVAVLLAAARRWAEADPAMRTRGGLFDRAERERIEQGAARVAQGVERDCDVDVVAGGGLPGS